MPAHTAGAVRIRLALVCVPAMLALAACTHGANTSSASDTNRPSLKAARAALSEGEADTSLGIAKGILSVEPKNVAALVQAGDAEVALGNHVTAEHDYRAALGIDPSYVPARLGMAKLKLRDDAKAAEADFRTILAANPRDAAAMTDLGVALDLQERHKEAQAQYMAALAINPDLTSPRVNMGLSLALSGDPMKAEEMLRDATEAGPVPAKVRADFALAQVMAGHSEDAEQTLQADLSADEAKASVQGMQGLMPAGK
jgi:Flp pilus assembly protein TadD